MVMMIVREKPTENAPLFAQPSSDNQFVTVVLVFVWLAVYIPSYYLAYGSQHFLQLCNVGVLISCLALMTKNSILISSQFLASAAIAVFWLADVLSFLFIGQHLHGGTQYLWDSSIFLPARILSVYHIVLPVILWREIKILGYDGRGFVVQTLITAIVFSVSCFIATPDNNLNYLYELPSITRFSSGVFVNAIVSWLLTIVVLLLPVHFLLSHCLRKLP